MLPLSMEGFWNTLNLELETAFQIKSTRNSMERAMLDLKLKGKIRLENIKYKFRLYKNILHLIRRIK